MLKISAPAKLNLHLHVTGKRDDGYHLLDSLVCFADAADTLIFETSDRFAFHVEGPFANHLADTDHSQNTVVRAAKAVAELASKDLNLLRITLQKNLPPGGGIGGGSADGAACLWGLHQFWSLNIPDERLADLGLQIGSDIPVCLKSSPAIMQGIGEIILPAPDVPEIPIVMIWPNQHTPTPAVFKNLQMKNFSKNANFKQDYDTAESLISDLAFHTRNDLEKSAEELFPIITTALHALKEDRNCHFARMSGSGSTVFGVFGSEEKAQMSAEKIQRQYSGWWVRPCWLNRTARY